MISALQRVLQISILRNIFVCLLNIKELFIQFNLELAVYSVLNLQLLLLILFVERFHYLLSLYVPIWIFMCEKSFTCKTTASVFLETSYRLLNFIFSYEKKATEKLHSSNSKNSFIIREWTFIIASTSWYSRIGRIVIWFYSINLLNSIMSMSIFWYRYIHMLFIGQVSILI